MSSDLDKILNFISNLEIPFEKGETPISVSGWTGKWTWEKYKEGLNTRIKAKFFMQVVASANAGSGLVARATLPFTADIAKPVYAETSIGIIGSNSPMQYGGISGIISSAGTEIMTGYICVADVANTKFTHAGYAEYIIK